jgi:hypothetical protein
LLCVFCGLCVEASALPRKRRREAAGIICGGRGNVESRGPTNGEQSKSPT